LADFVWWSGLSTNDARRGIALLDRDIQTIQLGPTVYWTSNSAPKPSLGTEAHLLPAYDEYNVAYKNRQLVFDRDSVSKITNAGALGPTVIIDGRIIGTWKATIAANSITLNLTPSRPLRKQENLAVAKAAERFRRWSK
jgi:hypothetical protein